jgi:hypothetical protein
MKTSQLTVRFSCNNKITKTREIWIKELLENALENCQSDTRYNDQTIWDLLEGGFIGFVNMTDEQLADEIYNQLDHYYQDESEAAA